MAYPCPEQKRLWLIGWMRNSLGTSRSVAVDSSSPGCWLLGRGELGSRPSLNQDPGRRQRSDGKGGMLWCALLVRLPLLPGWWRRTGHVWTDGSPDADIHTWTTRPLQNLTTVSESSCLRFQAHFYIGAYFFVNLLCLGQTLALLEESF